MAKKRVAASDTDLKELEKKFIQYTLDVEKAFNYILNTPPPPPPYGPQCKLKLKALTSMLRGRRS